MPCIFCLAVVALVAGALSAAAVDELEEQLAEVTTDPPRRAADTDSVVRWEASVDVEGKRIDVVVTVYKEHGRVRIQVLSHALSREQIEALEDRIAEALGAEVVSRSDEESEAKVREAHGEHPSSEARPSKDTDSRRREHEERERAREGRRREPPPPQAEPRPAGPAR